jgi:acyl dehydratase
VNFEKVSQFKLDLSDQTYTFRDTILYALGLGYGSDPLDPAQLEFVYEQGLKSVPSISNVLAHPGFWLKQPEFQVDWVKILHGEQSFEIHKPIPPSGTVRGEFFIEAIDDKGPEKGAVLYQMKRLYQGDTNELIASVRSVVFLRGDGGCGSIGTPPAAPTAIPDGEPDQVCEIATLPQQALIYRLSGDYNPLHADPAPARKAGFDRPILHGLCTMGLATRALLSTYLPGNPDGLKSMFVRFSKPVFPGETIITEFYRTGNEIRFRCRVKERETIVLDRGRATLA